MELISNLFKFEAKPFLWKKKVDIVFQRNVFKLDIAFFFDIFMTQFFLWTAKKVSFYFEKKVFMLKTRSLWLWFVRDEK
jgi:hypothetical protein